MQSQLSKLPLVSVLIACYNGDKFIRDAVRSVLNQDYHKWEIVFVDDCSTDTSFDLMAKLAWKWGISEKTTIVQHAGNMGYGATLKTAVDNSHGKIFLVLDVDDALNGNNAISTAVKYHQKYPEVAMTYSNYMECDRNLKDIDLYRTRQLLPDEKYIDTKIRISHLKAIKRFYYDLTDGYDGSLRRTVDKDLTLKLEEVGGIKHIDMCLYKYRKGHGSNVSLGKKPKKQEAKSRQDRERVYKDAKNRRSQQSDIWLNGGKCRQLQAKWGDYDEFHLNPRKNKGEIIKVLRKTIGKFAEKPTVLEVGCGAGHFLWAIRTKVKKLVALDYSPGMLFLTQEQFEDENIPLETVHASCWKTTLPDNSVDVAYQVDVCMHIGGSWKSIVEMLRVSKRFVIFTGPSFEPEQREMDKNLGTGKRWGISLPLLKNELAALKATGKIKSYSLKHRTDTANYKHKILFIEKATNDR
jgi:glycosyltransferase involved in cell wall biosynthesis